MKKLILLVAPPGAGKSAYASSLQKEGYVRISQDDQGKEGHLQLFHNSIKLGLDIVVDRMNFSKQQRERYLKPAKEAGYDTRIVVFHVPSDVCLRRCVDRIKGEGHPTIKTPEDASRAIDMFFRKYERISDDDADSITRLGWNNPNKLDIIVSDLDNTLCDTSKREHFLNPKDVDSEKAQKNDWKNFFKHIPTDTVNEWAKNIINTSDKVVFLVSARPEEYRDVTVKWLKENNIKYDALIMRRRGDYRPDAIVKEIIYEYEIKPIANVLFWLDDRKVVIDKIRSHGVTVLDCAGESGNF